MGLSLDSESYFSLESQKKHHPSEVSMSGLAERSKPLLLGDIA